MTTDLPGTNYSSPYGTDDLAFEQQVYRDEFLERMRLVFGHPTYIASSSYGIVAETDPSNASTGSTEPGALSANGTQITVQPLVAVTKSGHRIVVSSAVTKTVASSELNAINVVTVKFSTANPSSASTGAYHGLAYRRREAQTDTNMVAVYTLAQYNALTDDQKNDHVALGVGTVTTDGSGSTTVSLTHNDTNYTWLRPWFSPVDIEHRKQVGSGTVSTTNPHGISANELTIGNFTMPRLTTYFGMVVSQDVSYPHVPGTVCAVSITSAQILTDDAAGTVTGESSTSGVKYIDLGFFPTALGSVYDASGNEYPFMHREGTTLIYQLDETHIDLQPASALTVYCSRVAALEPAYSSVISTFTAGALGSYDAVIANGQVKVSGSSLTLTDSMSDAGPIPAYYTFYLAGDQVVKNPQVLMCYTKLTSISSSGVTPSITQFGNGVAVVALDQASAGASLDVQIKITGKDVDNVDASETFTFGASWTQSTFPLCSTPTNQFSRGSTVFSSITNISVLQNSNSGANASIQVWVSMEPSTATTLRGACPIAQGQWNGSNLCTLYDVRPVSHCLQMDDHTAYAGGIYEQVRNPDTGAEPGSTHGRGYMYVESFVKPKYGTLKALDSSTSGAFSVGPERTQLFDGNFRGLNGYYESRAFTLSNGNDSTLDCFVVMLWPYKSSLMEPSVRYQRFDSATGVWSNWLTLSNASNHNTTGFFGDNPMVGTPPATTCAIKLQIYGYGLLGYTLIEYT
jgi:hypothetical protein